MKRLYTVHVQDLGTPRVVEWVGNADSDTEARMHAQAAAFHEFGNSGKVLGLNLECVIDNGTARGMDVKVYSPNKSGDREVPVILVPRGSIKETRTSKLPGIIQPEKPVKICTNVPATDLGQALTGADTPIYL